MPEIGYRSTYGEKKPGSPLETLSWSGRVEQSKTFFITVKNIQQTRLLLHQSHDKKRYGRLLRVLEDETGHSLLAAAESAKIALTDQQEFATTLDFIDNEFSLTIKRALFEEAIHRDIEKIAASARECLQLAGVTNEAIELVILTGGSTEVPAVQAEFKRLFPNADIADENKLSSVGLGLAYDSQNKFGTPVRVNAY